MPGAGNSRISQIQQELQKRKAFAAIFPSADAHISEYVAGRWKARDWVSGFHGSAGTAVLTREKAALWTDSRYFLEAGEALRNSDISLMKEGLPGTPALEDWIVGEFQTWGGGDAQVLVSGETLSLSQFNETAPRLRDMELRAVDDLLDTVWTDRPPLPSEKIYEISSRITGESRETRLSRLKEELGRQGISAFLVSALDEIAWILNLRGSDVEYNPVFYAYLLVSEKETLLCTHYADMSPSVRSALEAAGISLAGYGDIEAALKAQEGIIGADPASLNVKIAHILEKNLKPLKSPLKLWKAGKTAAELASTRQVMELDGVAMVKLLHWLEKALERGEELSELKVSNYIERFRAEHEDCIGSSFAAIVGFQEHGAIIHYTVDEKSNKAIRGGGLLLIDSGGQYRGGTTDITRTLAIGTVPRDLREQYTLVLKGHIGLARAVFPAGSTGAQLDSLARRPLWEHGLNYGHGTGHGVGFALNVHEGPQNISPRPLPVALEIGMICSNEPGFYEEGSHGIRIENLLAVRLHATHPAFLCFETLSLCPLEPELIQGELLSQEEISWVNSYHRLVWERLSPLLSAPQRNWLKGKTREL